MGGQKTPLHCRVVYRRDFTTLSIALFSRQCLVHIFIAGKRILRNWRRAPIIIARALTSRRAHVQDA